MKRLTNRNFLIWNCSSGVVNIYNYFNLIIRMNPTINFASIDQGAYATTSEGNIDIDQDFPLYQYHHQTDDHGYSYTPESYFY
jgi:hypothetical protein